MTPTEWIKHLTIKKTSWDLFSKEEQKSYLPYIMNLWLAMCPEFIEMVNEVQKYQVPNKDHYNFYLKLLPRKQPYFRWLKAKKKEYSKDVVEKISAFYSVSMSEICDSIHILSKQDITNILQQMGIGDKEIIKLLK